MSQPLLAKDGWRGNEDETYVTHALTSAGADASEDGTGRGTPLVIADTLTSGSHPGSNMPGRRREDDSNLVAYSLRSNERNTSQGPGNFIAGPLGGGNDGTGRRSEDDPNLIPQAASVRRLTPVECERLQGFPDGWTDLGGTPDSRRYAALGDAVTVPVAEWIGRRILEAL